MSSTKRSAADEPTLDPVYKHSRREASEILGAWALAILWTILYCSMHGYEGAGEEVDLIGGIPSWVFWGVGVPWSASSVFTLVYSLFRMRNDPLGEQQAIEEAPSDEMEA